MQATQHVHASPIPAFVLNAHALAEELPRVLIVSGNTSLLQKIRSKLTSSVWNIGEANHGCEALDILHEQHGADLLLLDPNLPDLLPAELCGMIAERFPKTEILSIDSLAAIVQSPDSSLTPLGSRMVRALQNVEATPIAPRPMNAGYYLREETQVQGVRGMVGRSAAMQKTFSLTNMVAKHQATVLITGESGTGKDLIAQGIHTISPRKHSSFVVVNCAAIPEALLESELFGYAKGAFTGAMQSRIGRIHAAHGGTLFLDEIGDMPLTLQSKILRFLEQGEVQRLGGNDNLKVDVRVIAATNVNLPALVKQKLFREDLYYRLAVFPIQLAPLRERMDDIPSLAISFAAKFCPGTAIAPEVFELLSNHTWPGNIRELKNVMERASVLLGSSQVMTAEHILL